MILITTSHRPSPRTRSFVKDLSSVIPFSRKINRGHKTLQELAIEAYIYGLNYIFIVCEKRGNPSKIDIYRINRNDRFPSSSILSSWVLKGVRLSREIPDAKRIYNPKNIYVDYSKCISNDCFTIADTMINILRGAITETENMQDLTMVLNDGKYITISWRGPGNKIVGPQINVIKVINYGTQDRDNH